MVDSNYLDVVHLLVSFGLFKDGPFQMHRFVICEPGFPSPYQKKYPVNNRHFFNK